MGGEREPRALGRARFEDRGSALGVVIPGQRRILLLVFLLPWLVGWFVGERKILEEVSQVNLRSSVGGAALVLFLVAGWTAGGVYAAAMVLWTLFGREVITIDEQSLSIRREALGVGRTHRYQLAQVKDLRWIPSTDSRPSRRAPWEGGLIAFDHGKKTIRFARPLDDAEAKVVAKRLAERIPSGRQTA
jgi:hypothetical protein